MVNYSTTADKKLQSGCNFKEIALSDLENSVRLSPYGTFKGHVCGNRFWRSPEAWAGAKQDLSSDMYSFAIMVSIPFLHE
jgi:serine/threonine protein kinase